MFGYIKPDIPELRVREKLRYDAWYCGLCGCLGRRYGPAARACLSYDCTFLALILQSVCDEAPVPSSMHVCPFKPLGRKRPMLDGTTSALEFAAGACVLLAMHKLNDSVRDGRPLYGTAKLPIHRAFLKAKRDFPEAAEAIEQNLAKLSEIEAAKEPCPDAAAGAFGELLRELLAASPAPKSAMPVLNELGMHLGRYIYLLDAWDDRRNDAKRGCYNPFVISGMERARAEFLINFSINSALSAYDLLEVRSEKELIDNILTQGCFAAADKVFDKEASDKK